METAGGGRITIISDSLVLNGFGVPISANAKPYETFTAPYKEPGGSGGYIYIKTWNRRLQNEVNEDIRIEAKGGYGTNGGSGGVIVFEHSFEVSEEQVSAEGGTSTKKEEAEIGCGDGAAGTIFMRGKRGETRLTVDNKGKMTNKNTFLVPF